MTEQLVEYQETPEDILRRAQDVARQALAHDLEVDVQLIDELWGVEKKPFRKPRPVSIRRDVLRSGWSLNRHTTPVIVTKPGTREPLDDYPQMYRQAGIMLSTSGDLYVFSGRSNEQTSVDVQIDNRRNIQALGIRGTELVARQELITQQLGGFLALHGIEDTHL